MDGFLKGDFCSQLSMGIFEPSEVHLCRILGLSNVVNLFDLRILFRFGGGLEMHLVSHRWEENTSASLQM